MASRVTSPEATAPGEVTETILLASVLKSLKCILKLFNIMAGKRLLRDL